ncbi:MAG: glycosyltransferase [Actinomycetota bacterium]
MAATTTEGDSTAQRRPRTALVQDHVAQRGGAERVGLVLLEALGTDTLHTSVYAPERTYPEFAAVDVRPRWFSRLPLVRRDHRYAFPLMPLGMGGIDAPADVLLTASAGWSHGVKATGRKVVYWFAPPRWIYQQDDYLGSRGWISRAVRAATPLLRIWDRRAVRSADRHLAVSEEVADRLRRFYGVEAEVVHPPLTLAGTPKPVDGIDPGYLLVVSRLLSYKHVHVVAEAMAQLPDRRLVVVGTGPFEDEIRRRAPDNVDFVGSVSDDELSWLYGNCAVLVAAAFEDFGLTPLEAADHGRPTVALRAGGYLDTIEEGRTGWFFESLAHDDVLPAIEKALATDWDPDALRAHAARFSNERFVALIQAIVEEEVRCQASDSALAPRTS